MDPIQLSDPESKYNYLSFPSIHARSQISEPQIFDIQPILQKKEYFIHPNNNIAQIRFTTVQEILLYFDQIKLHDKVLESVKWNIKYIPSQKIINIIRLNCNLCGALVQFRHNAQNVFELRQLKNQHRHTSHNSSRINKIMTKSETKSTLNQNQIHKQVTNKMQRMLDMKTINNSNKQNAQNKTALESFFKSYNYQYIFFDAKNINITRTSDYPSIILAIAPQMKQQYNLFGQMLSFDITYNLIKNNTKYGVGVFSGKNYSQAMLIFGIALISNESITSFQLLFINFFEIVGSKTTIIITDQQQSIAQAIINLQKKGIYKGHHAFDSWHSIRSFSINLRRNRIKKNPKKVVILQIQQKYRDLIKSKTKNKFRQCLEQLQKYLTKYFPKIKQQIIKRILDKVENLSYAHCPKLFIGIGMATNQKLNDLIKRKIPQETSINQFYQAIHQLTIQRIVKAQTKTRIHQFTYQIFFKDDQLKILRTRLYCKIFSEFMIQYCESLKLDIKSHQNKNDYVIKNIQNNEEYIVKSRNCECYYYEKSGLPCCHILKIVRENNENYLSYIKKRWILPISIKTLDLSNKPSKINLKN